MLVVGAGWQFCQFSEWNTNIEVTQRLSSICIVKMLQPQQNHIAFVWAHAFNDVAHMVGAKIYDTAFCKAVGDIGEQAYFQFAMHTKKGYHFTDGGPLCFSLLWHDAL